MDITEARRHADQLNGCTRDEWESQAWSLPEVTRVERSREDGHAWRVDLGAAGPQVNTRPRLYRDKDDAWQVTETRTVTLELTVDELDQVSSALHARVREHERDAESWQHRHRNDRADIARSLAKEARPLVRRVNHAHDELQGLRWG